jgi:hypothetical protein
MKLFFDEDTGKGIPEALRALEIGQVDYLRRAFKKRIRRGEFPNGVPDEAWIPYAGRGGFLVLSFNKAILETEAQRELWIAERVGGVFITSHKEKKREVMLLILKKWDWLETIDRHERRPFAYRMPLSGTARLDPLVQAAAAALPAVKGIVPQI